MIASNKNIYIQETEVKPNKYAILVLQVFIIGALTCWLMNELDLFRVGDLEMRVGSSISVLLCGVPITLLRLSPKRMEDPKTKYIVMTCATILTYSTSTLLTFHTTILLLFPIFIAMLYRSKELGIYALVSSLSCTIISPILSCLLHAWDVPLFQELILIQTGGNAIIEGATNVVDMIAIRKILLYIVFPRLIMVGSCAYLMFYVINLSVNHVENQVKLNEISHHDALTGLYNQNYYKEVIKSNDFKDQVGVIFFDVNGLKTANDLNGHEYGDLLLAKCASSIVNNLDETCEAGFRIGGDEFVVISENANQDYIENKIKLWNRTIDEINEENKRLFNGLHCSMAIGYAIGDFKNIEELVKEADSKMYDNKIAYKKKSNKK